MSLVFNDAIMVARELLGCELTHVSNEGVAGGIIVETEAYHSADEASHTFAGPSKRNAPMFLSGGHIYVYFTYGMHYCFNIVTGEAGDGQGVLIRALQPTIGVALMRKRRQRQPLHELTNGPAKLVQALGIHKSHNGLTLAEAQLTLARKWQSPEIAVSPRKGISKAKDAPLRFYIPGNQFVS